MFLNRYLQRQLPLAIVAAMPPIHGMRCRHRAPRQPAPDHPGGDPQRDGPAARQWQRRKNGSAPSGPRIDTLQPISMEFPDRSSQPAPLSNRTQVTQACCHFHAAMSLSSPQMPWVFMSQAGPTPASSIRHSAPFRSLPRHQAKTSRSCRSDPRCQRPCCDRRRDPRAMSDIPIRSAPVAC
jgi:hypothetical protein